MESGQKSSSRVGEAKYMAFYFALMRGNREGNGNLNLVWLRLKAEDTAK